MFASVVTQYQAARLKRAGRRCAVLVCHEQTKRVAPLSMCNVSATPPGQVPMPVVATHQLIWYRCAYSVVKLRGSEW